MRTYWAMTEANGIFTRPDDPPDRAAHGIGRPAAGLEIDLRPDGGEPITLDHPGRLHVRGPGVCLAVGDRDGAAVTRVSDRDDGWYETGDLAVPDGHDGYTLLGRAVDRVSAGAGAFMVPVGDVEDALREHWSVADVALIETHRGTEPLPCAVVVPATDTATLTLEEIRSFLLDRGMTDWFVPQRLEIVDRLPRNAMGKVQKAVLRRQYVDQR